MQAKLTSVPTELPEPPYPENTKAQGWAINFDYERIEQSDTWALCPADMRPWLLMLWYSAWKQIPACSYTNDDQIIAAKIGMPVRMFDAHRDILLRGWVLHSDGRIYHPVLVLQLAERMGRKNAERERKNAYREKMKAEREARKKDFPMDVPRDRRGTDADVHGKSDTTSTSTSTSTSLDKKEEGTSYPLSSKGSTLPPWADVERVLDDLNARTGSRFQLANNAGKKTSNAEAIRQRMREFDLQTCLAVVAEKSEEWIGTDFEKYLTPATLFRKSKFEKYAGTIGKPKNETHRKSDTARPAFEDATTRRARINAEIERRARAHFETVD